MKHIILAFAFINFMPAAVTAAPYSSYEAEGEDYGDNLQHPWQSRHIYNRG